MVRSYLFFPGTGFYKTLSVGLLTNRKMLTSVLTTKLNHSRFQKLTEWIVCSNPNKSPSNADAYFESTKIKKTWLFSNTVSSNNGVFKGKVFEQNETIQPIEKSSRKFWFANKITLYKNPTITCRVLTISHDNNVRTIRSRHIVINTKNVMSTRKKSVEKYKLYPKMIP